MSIKKLKEQWKEEVINILLALVGSAIALFAFNYFNPPIENMFAVVIFFLILILVKLSNKK